MGLYYTNKSAADVDVQKLPDDPYQVKIIGSIPSSDNSYLCNAKLHPSGKLTGALLPPEYKPTGQKFYTASITKDGTVYDWRKKKKVFNLVAAADCIGLKGNMYTFTLPPHINDLSYPIAEQLGDGGYKPYRGKSYYYLSAKLYSKCLKDALDYMRKKILKKGAKTFEYIAVFEYQKRGALHAHVWTNCQYFPIKDLNSKWSDLLHRHGHLPSKNCVDYTKDPSTKKSERNVAPWYLAKYISKGSAKFYTRVYRASNNLVKCSQPIIMDEVRLNRLRHMDEDIVVVGCQRYISAVQIVPYDSQDYQGHMKPLLSDIIKSKYYGLIR